MGNLGLPLDASAGFGDLAFLWLEITPKCNLECRHCYADSGPRRELFGAMTTSDWLNVLRESAQTGCKQVQFIGGEPTLHPNLIQMISFASAEGYTYIEVFTNATAISAALLEALVRAKAHIAVSFYSDDPAVHDSITKRKGSFNRTVAGIKRMVAAGLSVRAGVIETEQNAGHGSRAERFLRMMGVEEISLDIERGVGRGSVSAHSADPMEALCGECWKGKLCVTSSGAAYPCVFSRFVNVGSVSTHGVNSILAGKKLTAFRMTLKQYLRDRQASSRASQDDCAPEVRCEPTCTPPGRFINCTPDRMNPLRCSPAFIPCGPQRCNPLAEPCTPLSPCNPQS